ncbi:MAG: PH domain-containing protein [Bacteroidota bacterium]|nr:PH domain-containing protein [Bacteroidota bacterium]MDP3143850.1 PH domain-containing protein [Bacteroidota bacterium]
MIDNEIILNKATFNPKVKTYIYLIVLFYLFVSVIGWLLLPFWLLGLGNWISTKFFNTLECQLTSKNLRFSKGIIFHIEKTIPLENIQDLSFYGGPILRAFGLTLIRIETAGGGGKHDNNMMSMLGINGAENFKVEILNQREKVMKEKYQFSSPVLDNTNSEKSDELLREIKNVLVEIKEALKK